MTDSESASSGDESVGSSDGLLTSSFEERARATLRREDVVKWITKVMQRKPIKNWVWPVPDLMTALKADDASKWSEIQAIVDATGSDTFVGLCEENPDNFVFTGIHEGEKYIACRISPLEVTIDIESDYEPDSSWQGCGYTCGFYAVFWYVASFLGTILNYIACCFWYIIPNCFCIWRWALCHKYWKVEEVIDEMQTGDILLFCGTMSTRIGGQAHWSHAGIVLRDTEGHQGPPGLLYVFEANFDRPGWNHCDIRLLREKLETYKKGATDIAWRPLKCEGREEEVRRAVADSIFRHRGSPYDHDLQRMALAAIDFCPCFEVRRRGSARDMFCSQAVAQVLQDAGVIPGPPEGPPACEYLPRDFGIVPSGNEERALLDAKLGYVRLIARQNNKWTGLDCR
eukprot:TRINITY_DN32180_c0_g1_i1.p1 TRINITY_DN32180_c0_g1~~TRINITY_DN32180_c0_g1_i1.p1  ORF type:complete len:399 (-),score=77.80 TRINITY_DN32180_c0_g1_i1:24-1220(-)